MKFFEELIRTGNIREITPSPVWYKQRESFTPEQEKYVSNPIRSLAQAYVYRNQCQPFGDSNRVALTCNKDNLIAMKLYEDKGFAATGYEDEEEIELAMIITSEENKLT